jgi:hypothetical protein
LKAGSCSINSYSSFSCTSCSQAMLFLSPVGGLTSWWTTTPESNLFCYKGSPKVNFPSKAVVF